MIGCCAASSCLAASPQWVKNGCSGRSTGSSAVPQLADDFGSPRKSVEVCADCRQLRTSGGARNWCKFLHEPRRWERADRSVPEGRRREMVTDHKVAWHQGGTSPFQNKAPRTPDCIPYHEVGV